MASKTTNMELLLGVYNLYQVFNYLDNRITAPALGGRYSFNKRQDRWRQFGIDTDLTYEIRSKIQQSSIFQRYSFIYYSIIGNGIVSFFSSLDT